MPRARGDRGRSRDLDPQLRELLCDIRREHPSKGADKLKLLRRNAKETLTALNVELTDAGAERAESLVLGSLGDVRGEEGGARAAE